VCVDTNGGVRSGGVYGVQWQMQIPVFALRNEQIFLRDYREWCAAGALK
jgi:hypothetical protein